MSGGVPYAAAACPSPSPAETDPALAPAHAARALAVAALGDGVLALGPDATPATIAALARRVGRQRLRRRRGRRRLRRARRGAHRGGRRARRHRRAGRAQRRVLAASGAAPHELGRGRVRRAALAAPRRPRRPAPGRAAGLRARARGRAPQTLPARRSTLAVELRRGGGARGLPAAFGPRAAEVVAAAAGAAVVVAGRPGRRARPRRTALESEVQLLRAQVAALGGARRVKVAFLVNDLQLSGGVGVVVAHARQLAERHGIDVTLVLAREQELPHWEHDGARAAPRGHAGRRARAPQPSTSRSPRGGRRRSSLFTRPGRALRVLRAVARGPLLPARPTPSDLARR